jgi:hypothetical protein
MEDPIDLDKAKVKYIDEPKVALDSISEHA